MATDRLEFYVSPSSTEDVKSWETTLVRYAAILADFTDYWGEFTNRLRIRSYFNFLPFEEQCRILKNNVSTEEDEKEDHKKMMRIHDRLRQLRKCKHRDQNQSLLYTTLMNCFNSQRDVFFAANNLFLAEFGLYDFQDFYAITKEDYNCIYGKPASGIANLQNVKAYSSTFTTFKEYPFLGQVIEKNKEIFSTDSTKNVNLEVPLFSEVLFTLPIMATLDYDELKFVKNDIRTITHELRIAINDFSEYMKNFIMNDEGINELRKFYSEKVTPLLHDVREKINNNIYIEREIINIPEIPKLNFCLGAVEAKIILEYYAVQCKIDDLIPYIKKEIKDSMPLESIKVFFYLKKEIPPAISQ